MGCISGAETAVSREQGRAGRDVGSRMPPRAMTDGRTAARHLPEAPSAGARLARRLPLRLHAAMNAPGR